MAKLFRGKVQPFGASGLRFTQSALLAAVAIVGLKSLVEFIRLQTLGKAGTAVISLHVCACVRAAEWQASGPASAVTRCAQCAARVASALLDEL